MPDSDQEQLLKETYRLAQENNKMLRSMRRQAWLGRIITLIFYAALIGVPVWFYFTYMSDTVNQLLETYSAAKARGAEMQDQYESFTEMFKQFQEKMTGGGGESSSESTPQ
ncbi:MAG TPA: hypothetical protein VJK53_05970 [Candidatus Paceibacterota bacterium]